MKVLFTIVLFSSAMLVATTCSAAANHLNQGEETDQTLIVYQSLLTANPGKKQLFHIVQQGAPFPNQPLRVSRQAAHRILNHSARHDEQNSKKKGYARVGMAQLLAQWGFYPKDTSVEEHFTLVLERLNNIWVRRENHWHPDVLKKDPVKMRHPKKFIGSVGIWMALLKSDLYQRGFLEICPDKRDLQGAWDLLNNVHDTYSKSKTLFLLMAGILLEGIGRNWNPFSTEDERNAEIKTLLANFEAVSHNEGTHSRGTRRPQHQYGQVQKKQQHKDRDLHKRVRAYLATQQQDSDENNNEDDREDDNHGNGTPPPNPGIAPSPAPPSPSSAHSAPEENDNDNEEEDDDHPMNSGDPEDAHQAPQSFPSTSEEEEPAAAAAADSDDEDEDKTTSLHPNKPLARLASEAEAEAAAADSDDEDEEKNEETSDEDEDNKRFRGKRQRVLNSDDEDEDKDPRKKEPRPDSTSEEDKTTSLHPNKPLARLASEAEAEAAAADSDDEDEDRSLRKDKKFRLPRKEIPLRDKKILDLYKKGYSQSRIVTALEMEYPEITKEIVCSSYRRSHITNPTQPPQKNMTEEDRNAIWDAAMDMKEEGNQVNYKKIAEEMGFSHRQIARALKKKREEMGIEKKAKAPQKSKEEIKDLHTRILEAYVEQQQQGKVNIRALAERFGVKAGYISSKVITPASKKGQVYTQRLPKEKKEELEEYVKQNLDKTNEEIANNFNVQYLAGAQIVQEHTVKMLRPHQKRPSPATPQDIINLKEVIADHQSITDKEILAKYEKRFPNSHEFSIYAVGRHRRDMGGTCSKKPIKFEEKMRKPV